MQVTLNVQLMEGDSFSKNPDDLAQDVKELCGADEMNGDTVHVIVTPAPQTSIIHPPMNVAEATE
jgi:hypothetical protein